MAIKDLPAHRSNPFMKVVSQYRRGTKRTTVKGGKIVIDETTGEVDAAAEIVQIEEMDAEKFVKLYTADLRKFFSLRPASYRMLRVVLEQVQRTPNTDMVTLNVPLTVDFFERHNEKPPVRQTIYTALEEMIEKGFLARSEMHAEQYFINPALFFNGNRVRLVREYHIKRQHEMFHS